MNKVHEPLMEVYKKIPALSLCKGDVVDVPRFDKTTVERFACCGRHIQENGITFTLMAWESDCDLSIFVDHNTTLDIVCKEIREIIKD